MSIFQKWFKTRDAIGDLFDDDSLTDQQRQKNFWSLINNLADDERATVRKALKLPPN